jgi:AcrR family transcriptional regulator
VSAGFGDVTVLLPGWAYRRRRAASHHLVVESTSQAGWRCARIDLVTGIGGVGRPRLTAPRRPGASGRDQILDAAAQMFSEQGYSATSTRRIAEAVGVKQASLYYHFASKQDILTELLAGTVRPSLAFSARLARTDEPPHVQLYALTAFDVALLCSGRWNVGALYTLPELRAEQFEDFRRDRRKLKRAYGRRVAAGLRDGVFDAASAGVATALVFALAESVISMRADGVRTGTALGSVIATSCLRLLDCDATNLKTAAAECARLLALGEPVERQV